MNAVLVDPKGLTYGLNSGLGYIASSLKQRHNVQVVDFNNKPGNEEKRLEIVKNADFVGISIKSFTLEEAVKIANIVKKVNPTVKVMAGGPHISLDGYNFLKENKCFDTAIVGEGEKTFLDIVDKKEYDKIKGIIYREDEKIKINPKGDWIQDLDKLGFPDYTWSEKMDAYPLVTSRGCPYQCSYCSVRDVMGMKWRGRSPKNIIEELKQAKQRYDVDEFRILDDNFTMDMSRAKEFCGLLIKENINMRWSCPNGIRADRFDEELLKAMKKSGCYSISLGIESLHPEVFEMINKGERLEAVKNAARMIKEAGMKVNGFFIVGLPGSTYEKDKFSIKEAKKLGLNSASWGIFVPYPGTWAWKWLQEEIRNERAKMLRDWKKGFHIGFSPKPVFETSEYSSKERVKAYYWANISTMGWKIIPNAFKLLLKGVGI